MEKKEEIWLSPMTKAPTLTEKSKKQRPPWGVKSRMCPPYPQRIVKGD